MSEYSIVFCIETSSNVSLYRIDFTCVSKRLRLASKRLVSKQLCIETTGFRIYAYAYAYAYFAYILGRLFLSGTVH